MMLKKETSFGRVLPTLAWVILDAGVVGASAIAAYWLRFDGPTPAVFTDQAPFYVLISVIMFIVSFAVFALYRPLWRFAGLETFSALAAATALAGGIMFVTLWVLHGSGIVPVPRSIPVVQSLFVFAGAAAWRMSGRFPDLFPSTNPTHGKRVLIFGAGSAGALLMRDIVLQPDLGLHVVGFLDDDPLKQGRTVGGIPVIGTLADFSEVVSARNVEEVLIALPSATNEVRKRVIEACAEMGIRARIINGLARPVRLSSLEDVSILDLLGRDPVVLEDGPARDRIQGATVAVTGAAGSIGSELCRQIVTLRPAHLLLIDVDESRLYELLIELESVAQQVQIHLCLVDVRDATAVRSLFARFRPDLVIHAAAYKHVPVMEDWPCEAYKTNVAATKILLEECKHAEVGRFVLISTDKAVDPANQMGLSKCIAELCVLRAASLGQDAVAVRFGNVLGSRGSVIPLFARQLRNGGPLLVTHPDVTRYFMTIPEAARLVLQASAMEGMGAVYVLEMGEPVKVLDVARKIIALSDAQVHIEFIGLRPGEKLHERLSDANSSLAPSSTPGILELVQRPELPEDFDELLVRLIDAARDGDSALMRQLLSAITGLPLLWLDRPNTPGRTNDGN